MKGNEGRKREDEKITAERKVKASEEKKTVRFPPTPTPAGGAEGVSREGLSPRGRGASEDLEGVTRNMQIHC